MLAPVNKILYASDLEEGSRPAFRAAIKLCGGFKSEITYLHVMEPLSNSAQTIIDSIVDKADLKGLYDESLVNLTIKIEKRIKDFLNSELDESELLELGEIKSHIEEGVAWKTIIKVADDIDADVIVMGTRTSSSVGQFFTGSTANKVMLNSKRPLLIIPLV
jgi:nucleotide-binding universal stress UspA family protein